MIGKDTPEGTDVWVVGHENVHPTKVHGHHASGSFVLVELKGHHVWVGLDGVHLAEGTAVLALRAEVERKREDLVARADAFKDKADQLWKRAQAIPVARGGLKA